MRETRTFGRQGRIKSLVAQCQLRTFSFQSKSHIPSVNVNRLFLFSIKNQRLQNIYNEERDDLEKSFADIKKVFDSRTFKYEVLIAYWLSIHL